MQRRQPANKNDNGLPVDPAAAVQHLIRLSQKLADLGERETQALVRGDTAAFSVLQDEKEPVVAQYVRASEQFRNRIEEFRRLDKALLGRLEAIQKSIGEKAHSNNAMVARMQRRAETGIRESLLSAQEFGRQKPLRLINGEKHSEGVNQ